MANAKISDNSIFVPKTNITDIVGLAGYDNSGNVKISGAQLKASVLSGAIQTIAATSPLERTTGNDTVLSILEASTTQDGYLSSSNFIAFSDADGTVKSVGGTGTVSGITLSGTVTTSGNLELGGTLTIPSANIISFLGYTPYNNTNPSGFTSNTGTVSNLVFSSPLTGGTITSTGTVGITAASTNSDGYLTQGDWNTFNSKTSSDGTVTSVGGTGTVSGISLSGTVATSGNLTLGGALSLTSLNITNGLGFTPYNNTNPSGFTANTGTVTSVTTTAPLSGSVTSTGSLSITKANTNTNGYLSSTDWNTFDGKTSFAEPGIFSGGGTPTLAAGVTGTEIRTLIGAGTGDGDVTANSTTDFTNKTGSNSQWTNDENYTNNVGTVTAGNTITFTNKSGSNLQWTNDAGYITSAGDNTFVTSASLSGSTLTLTRNDSVTVDATGFLQVGSSSTDALAGNTTTITTQQATEISDNTLKTSFPGFGTVSGKALEGDTVIPTVNDGKLSISVDGTVTDFTANQSGDTSVTIVTGDSDNFYVTGASYTAGTLTLTRNGGLANLTATGFLQVGTTSSDALAGNTVTITGAQATEISANTAKKSNVQSDWSSNTGLSEILNKPTIPGEAPVDSVNTQTGVVVLDTDDISEGSNNLYYTEARVSANTNVAANTSKISFPGFGTTSTTALKGDTTIPTNNTQLTNGQNFITASSLPTVNDGTLTITVDGTATTFTANQSGNSSVSITTGSSDNFYVTEASYSAGTLTLTRNGSLADVIATGFLQIGVSSTTALAGNTTTITTAQANEITANTAKTGITTAQASEITANTAKVGITTAQANEITANTAKVGITTTQANEIIANTAKVTDTGVPALLNESGSVELGIGITAAEVREAIGAGTSNLAIGNTGSTALAGNTTIPTNTNQLTNGSGFISSLSGAVLTTTNQTVAGIKTFSSAPFLSSVTTNIEEEPPPALFLKGTGLIEKRNLGLNAFTSTSIPTNAVLTSGNQTVAGVKTFSSDLKVSTGSIAVGNISNSTTDGRIDASNDVVAFSTSDVRLKDNIKTIDNALDKVKSIQGIEFDWIEKEKVHGNSGHDIGVIAQEIEKVLPDVVTTRDSGYKAVKYEKIVPLLIEAIKELSNQVNELKNK